MPNITSLQPNYFLAFEILSLGTYLFVLFREIYQRNVRRIWEILSCTIFGMILEIGNIYLAHTYFYSDQFLIQFLGVPLAVGCGWATIMYSAMLLSDQYRLPWHTKPFLDALTAIVLDLSMDAIAIRMGFWTWAIPQDQEWYGVPFENLAGWIFVALSFSFTVRFMRTFNYQKAAARWFAALSPLIMYLLLLLQLVAFSVLSILPHQINNWDSLLRFNYRPDFQILFNPEVQLWKIIILMLIFTTVIHHVVMAIINYHRNYLKHFDLVSFSVLTTFHGFFMVILFTSGIYHTLPYLVVLGAILFAIHLLMHFLPYLLNHGLIYKIRAIQTSVEKEEHSIGKWAQRHFQ